MHQAYCGRTCVGQREGRLVRAMDLGSSPYCDGIQDGALGS